jgi:DNA-directed RNA polymerase specialized sigma24 family protein
MDFDDPDLLPRTRRIIADVIHRVLRRRGANLGAAELLTDQAMSRIFETRQTALRNRFLSESAFEGFVRVVAINAALDYLRQQYRRRAGKKE